MQQNYVAGIVLSILFILLLALFFCNLKQVHKEVIIFLLSILQVVSLFFVFSNRANENFLFEVSPQRKKCLIEQVSLNPSSTRGCECCQKGTVGGYPPLYREWLETNGERNQLWKRTDNYTTNPENTSYVNQLPATEWVS